MSLDCILFGYHMKGSIRRDQTPAEVRCDSQKTSKPSCAGGYSHTIHLISYAMCTFLCCPATLQVSELQQLHIPDCDQTARHAVHNFRTKSRMRKCTNTQGVNYMHTNTNTLCNIDFLCIVRTSPEKIQKTNKKQQQLHLVLLLMMPMHKYVSFCVS